MALPPKAYYTPLSNRIQTFRLLSLIYFLGTEIFSVGKYLLTCFSLNNFE